MFELAELASISPVAGEAELVARITALEQVKSAAAAGQARAAAALATARRAAETAAGVPASKRCRGLASEIALARRDAPVRGGQHLGLANALVHEMPYTLAALECGALSEWRATLIVRESACLDVEDRRALDREMCADLDKLTGKGDKRLTAEAKAIAYRRDPHAVVDRAAKAPQDRTVTIRPAPDTMSWVSVLLPVAQGVGVYATLRRIADTTFDGRSRGQVMADTVVERITGCPADAAAPVAVSVVISDTALLGQDTSPALLDGYGPIPAEVARTMIDNALTDRRSRASLRRLYARPGTGALVAMESRSRTFPRGLARFIGLRDQTCRTPYCDAPIRHRDHAQPWRRGGKTSADNGQGQCELCNYTKEAPGWQVTTGTSEGRHSAQYTTPTGAHYRSTAPPVPGHPRVDISEVETGIAITLINRHAA